MINDLIYLLFFAAWAFMHSCLPVLAVLMPLPVSWLIKKVLQQ